MKIAGLDIGTTGCKLTVFDEKGTYLDKAYCDYPVSRKTSGHEIDAAGILKGVNKVMQEMGSKYPDIAGIGVTSFGETFVMTDEKGTPLYPAMLYTDPRGKEECRELKDKLGEMRIAAITGVNPHEMYSISKMMWLKRHEPELYAKGVHMFLIEDFVIFHLTGNAQIDYSLASRTMAFDIQYLCWSKEILEAADIEEERLSKAVPTGTSAGHITEETAKATGMSTDTIIVNISHDQIAAAVGAGVFGSDTAVEGAGTVECITPVYDEIPDIRVMCEGNYALVPYVVPGKYVCYAFSYTGGALIQWCVDNLAKKEKELAKEEGISVNEYLERQTDSPTGMLVLPHFAGAATPYMDTGSKGAILGLTADTSAAEIYRACMEGVGYEMMLNMEYLGKSGTKFQMIHATGGGAKSAEWTQMKADMLNIPITTLETMDAGTVGSAMLTGIVTGCFKDLEDAAEKMVVKRKVFYPREEMHEKYVAVYNRYRQVYKAVRPLM
ncbi:MAG: FGGY-family carbohydrate kinase [Eubacteriales bacterium]|nr:FGGY-family carbohydrate kinase [Eubacteriales bacterium]